MKYFSLFFLTLFLTSCATTTITPKGMDFWEYHGFWQLMGWLCFPRLMFWFFSAITGGFGFWVGVFFAPRIMGAYWLTYGYWNTNPVLCVLAWLSMISLETAEKSTANNRRR